MLEYHTMPCKGMVFGTGRSVAVHLLSVWGIAAEGRQGGGGGGDGLADRMAGGPLQTTSTAPAHTCVPQIIEITTQQRVVIKQ